MAKGIGVLAANSIVTEGSTALELSVGRDDTTVNNIGVGILTRGRVIDVACGGACLVGDGTKTPRSTALRREGTLIEDLLYFKGEMNKLVWLDSSNLFDCQTSSLRMKTWKSRTLGLALISARVFSSNSPA